MVRESKHLVYAEDVIRELMQYPDNMIYKNELRRLVEKVVQEKEVKACDLVAEIDWETDGDLYD